MISEKIWEIGLNRNSLVASSAAVFGLETINKSAWKARYLLHCRLGESLLSVSVYQSSALGVRMLLSDAADAAGLNGPVRDLAGLVTVREGINPRASRSRVCSITHQGGQTFDAFYESIGWWLTGKLTLGLM